MKKISYIELGATLFIPAIHKDLEAVSTGVKYPSLKSVVIDLEDSISKLNFKDAIKRVKKLLSVLDKKKILVFIRPKDAKNLKKLLKLKNIQNVDGFVLPKFSLENASKYLKLLKNKDFYFMPSIEGSELFEATKLIELKDILLGYKNQIILVRFGLEDMLRQLNMKRDRKKSIFDINVTSYILGQFLSIFKGAGFGVSGGVYPYFEDKKGFLKDAKRDLKEGLFSKTIIHPNQIEPLNELYRVKKKSLDKALELIISNDAVFNQDGKMAESKTMKPYSEDIVMRVLVYGYNSKKIK